MSQISRRQAMAVLGALGFGATAAACAGPGGSTAPGGATGPAAPATGDITGKVSFAHWRGEDKAVFDELIKRFVAKNSGVEVIQDISTSNDYNAQGLQKVRGAAIGDAFATFRGAQFNNFSEAGIYTELKNSKAVGNYQKGLLTAGQSGDSQLGLPYQVVFPMPMANTDLFDKAGAELAPKDWDAFLGMCEKLAASGVVALSWPGGDVGNGGQLFNCMIANNAPVDDMCSQIEQGKLKCTDDWFIKMLNQYKDLAPYLQPNATGTAVEPAQNLFSQGKAAMLATGSYHIAAVRNLGAKFPIELVFPNTSTDGNAKFEGVYNATFILGVNSASKNQAASAAWIDFLSEPENAGYYANQTAQHVSVKDVEYTNADLKRLSPWLDKKTALAARFQFQNLDVRNAVEASATAVISGTSPEQAAEAAQKIVDERL
ncbi:MULTISPECIES: ABC transporter substrate-binding protein [Paenarthrobacter]|uniref:ABC transporter substrate-binding protein n=1 Tax=Paenarthrobacter TaxID=1742992 RepID=UPI001666EFCB|nr:MULTISPECIES: extracellular solute-binding protein [Paenarthrobacter]MBP2395140.1 raffinose/stachyose/melibiose transport system substrate-binding protein [Paenarthrobacter nicotinovorans]QOT23163.1 extracellular solute-binding protein [Paenarthrobacter sp. YJN-D]UKE98711.1 extracellular solute-binding protein [Paenarthrobacter nicotinovorans]UKF03500.1 extracellular solute-binding protein [Paenarthrobacter nicotinovorans]GGV36782.1 ABC transporter substrate-binding protein [Paenarthrobacte